MKQHRAELSRGSRSPEAIWEEPTAEETEQVKAALREYVLNGYFEFEPAGYCWGHLLGPGKGQTG
jgi:hypothetical protein